MKLLLTPHGRSSVILKSLLCIILCDIRSRFFITLFIPFLEFSSSSLFLCNLALISLFSDSTFFWATLVSRNAFSICSFSFCTCMRVALKFFRVFPICTRVSSSFLSASSSISFSSCISFNFFDISSICASRDLFCALITSSDFESCSLVASACLFSFCRSAFSFCTFFTSSVEALTTDCSC